MNEEKQDVGTDLRQGINFIVLLAEVHSLCVTVFIRRGFGIQYPGFVGVLALVLMLLYGGATDELRMIHFSGVWFVMLCAQRAQSYSLWRRGVREHTRYDGWPVVMMRFPFMKSEHMARNNEPILCFVLGIALLPWSQAVGAFVFTAGISLVISRAAMLYAKEKQLMAMHDLQLEQRRLAGDLRQLHSNGKVNK